jgi:hypothetical protein
MRSNMCERGTHLSAITFVRAFLESGDGVRVISGDVAQQGSVSRAKASSKGAILLDDHFTFGHSPL